jgi:hypothetical protein
MAFQVGLEDQKTSPLMYPIPKAEVYFFPYATLFTEFYTSSLESLCILNSMQHGSGGL